jgi:hypothetical protein
MQILDIEAYTRLLGESQGYRGLPVKDILLNDSVNGQGTPCMVSEWAPSQEELKYLSEGGTIKLYVLGSNHPPVRIEAAPLENS